ncbi:MAG: M23 family metallopeptidase [Methylococcales bacterium]|nr:M23 family metallopeptidase [Methylococcales bacterium]
MKIRLIIFLLLLSQPAIGKKLYKYQDENGLWFFTDQAPTTEKDVSVKQLDVDPKNRIKLYNSGSKDQPNFYVYNDFAGPAELEISFSTQQNTYSIPELPRRFVVMAGKSEVLFQVRAIDYTNPWSYQLSYKYVPGNPIENDVVTKSYLPPIAPNASFSISQGFGGTFSHTDESNKYAVDISMPVGTPIYAAREGVVMSVDNDFYKNGLANKYLAEANSIRILHDDGSMAVYGHLELEKAEVHAKLRVQAGQLIGYSGNTGFSSGPHLHFVVQVNKGMALTSIPFTFLSYDGKAEEPVLGKILVGNSVNSGK